MDNDLGQLVKAWLRLLRMGIELEPFQRPKRGSWVQKWPSFFCWSSRPNYSSLVHSVSMLEAEGLLCRAHRSAAAAFHQGYPQSFLHKIDLLPAPQWGRRSFP